MPFSVAYQFEKRIWYKQQRLIPQQTISDTGSASEVIDTLLYFVLHEMVTGPFYASPPFISNCNCSTFELF